MEIEFPLNIGTLTGRQAEDEYHFYLSFNDRRDKVYGPFKVKALDLLRSLKDGKDLEVVNSSFIENSGTVFGANASDHSIYFYRVPDGRMIYAVRPREDGGGAAKSIVSQSLFVKSLGLPEGFERFL